MKKSLWLIAVLLTALMLFACENNEAKTKDASKEADVIEVDQNVAAAIEQTEENATEENDVVLGEEKVDETVDRQAAMEGMNLGNISNSGFWTFQGSELFYTANYDIGIYNLETGNLSKVENHAYNSSYIQGNDMYISNITGIRRVNLKSGDYEQLSNVHALFLNVHDDWLYFVNSFEDDTVFKMKTDGSEIQKLSDLSSVRSLLYKDGYLFFNPYSEYNKLYRMKTDGSDLIVINNEWVPFFTIYNDMLYMSQHGEYGIYKSALDGSGKIKLTDNYCDFINVTNDYIFYNNSLDNSRLYRMNIDGSENELWLEQSVVYMCVNDGYLYFFNEKDPDYGVYRMHYDSRELEAMNLPNIIE